MRPDRAGHHSRSYRQRLLPARQDDVGLFNFFCIGTVNLMLIAPCILSLLYGFISEIRYTRRIAEAKAASEGIYVYV